MDTWIISVIAPTVMSLVAWILGKNSRRIDETSKLVGLLQAEISRLATKVEKLELRSEAKDAAIDDRNMIIQAVFECRTPSYKCPVLIKQSEINKNKIKNYDNTKSRDSPLQPWQHTQECHDIPGRDDESGHGLQGL